MVGLWAAWLFFFIALPLQAADIQVRASRDPLIVGESFALIFSSAESPDGEPDFSPLSREFEILDQGKSNNFQFINGQKSHSVTWTLELMPKRSGEIAIPAIAFGRTRSTPIRLNVLPANARPQTNGSARDDNDLLLEAEWSNRSPVVQEQIILTLRFLNAVPIAKAAMQEPKVTTGEALIEKLGEDQAFETTRNNRRYVVTERRYAIMPQKSGILTVDPIPLTVQLPGSGPGSSLLQEFFNDPFIKNLPLGPGRAGRTVSLSTEAVQIDVKPPPSAWRGGHWLALHRLELSEKWQPEPHRFQVGEPVTRTLTLQADGATAAQLPDLRLIFPDGVKSYPDKPQLEDQKLVTGIIGKSTTKVALIPSAPGEIVLPALEIPWWNIDKARLEVARVPERRIMVLPSAGTPAPSHHAAATTPGSRSAADAPASNSAADAPPGSSATGPTGTISTPPAKPEDGAKTEQQNNASATPAPLASPGAAAALPPSPSTPVPTDLSSVRSAGFWPWLTLFLTSGWLATLGAWWYQSQKRRAQRTGGDAQRTAADATRATLEALRHACEANDPKAAHTALLNYERADAPLLMDAIHALQNVLYGRVPTPWQGQTLWQALQADRSHVAASHEKSDILPPLYPT
ncbi:MAG: BatD family protein [Magnetococcus sp. YQC-9]